MAKVTGTRWEPFKRRWEGLEKRKKRSHMAKVTGTRWEPFKRQWEGLQKRDPIYNFNSSRSGNPAESLKIC